MKCLDNVDLEEYKDLLLKQLSANAKHRLGKVIIQPLNELVDQNVSDIVTTIGSFVVRKVRSKLQRSITIKVGYSYGDTWMEEALHGILYKYNNIKKQSSLEIADTSRTSGTNSAYFTLGDGTHSLKYRNYDILLSIQTLSQPTTGRNISRLRVYTVITYNLDPKFVTQFEADMISHRNSLLKINFNSSTINTYKDYHESDGTTYWDVGPIIPKRSLKTIYIPKETKTQLIQVINQFVSSKELYHKHGIPWNLKILLEGPAGTGKDSIAKAIASEWCRNIYYVTGGKSGKFIPEGISGIGSAITSPLYLISDIDKYPFIINEEDIDLTKNKNSQEQSTSENAMEYKQIFGRMINALDGTANGEGRIIIMSTNHIEKFSDTFLRPGRIDLKLHIGYVTDEVFAKYIYDFYGKVIPKNLHVKENITVAMMQFDVMFLKISYEAFIKKYGK